MKQYLIELSDEEYQVVSEKSLERIEDSAEQFDGFTGVTVHCEMRDFPEWLEKQGRKAINAHINL